MVRARLPPRKVIAETETLLIKNRIFLDRTQGVGILTKERALALGLHRARAALAGVDYDVRKDNPYLVYGELDFDVPVGTTATTGTASCAASKRCASRCASSSSASRRCPTPAP
jgi:NADH-quinone oxidoreductase subunit D